MSVAALAGRRIDAAQADAVRFPLSARDTVAAALRRLFRKEEVQHLFCSAACGADLLALKTAGALAIPTTIVLPFDPATFRLTSVIDRPGNWGPLYDKLIATARACGTLIDLGLDPDAPNVYDAVTARIISEARDAPADRRLAISVWEGQSRGANDATADFVRRAEIEDFVLRTIATTGAASAVI